MHILKLLHKVQEILNKKPWITRDLVDAKLDAPELKWVQPNKNSVSFKEFKTGLSTVTDVRYKEELIFRALESKLNFIINAMSNNQFEASEVTLFKEKRDYFEKYKAAILKAKEDLGALLLANKSLAQYWYCPNIPTGSGVSAVSMVQLLPCSTLDDKTMKNKLDTDVLSSVHMPFKLLLEIDRQKLSPQNLTIDSKKESKLESSVPMMSL